MASNTATTGKSAHMSSSLPTRKLQVGVLTGAIVTIIIWILNRNGADIPPEIATAILTIVAAIVTYIVPPSVNDQVIVE